MARKFNILQIGGEDLEPIFHDKKNVYNDKGKNISDDVFYSIISWTHYCLIIAVCRNNCRHTLSRHLLNQSGFAYTMF